MEQNCSIGVWFDELCYKPTSDGKLDLHPVILHGGCPCRCVQGLAEDNARLQ